MEVVSKARRVGGSMMVVIPKEVVREQRIRAGQLVRLDLKLKKPSFLGIARGVGSRSEDDKYYE